MLKVSGIISFSRIQCQTENRPRGKIEVRLMGSKEASMAALDRIEEVENTCDQERVEGPIPLASEAIVDRENDVSCPICSSPLPNLRLRFSKRMNYRLCCIIYLRHLA